jgi:predicted O-methyltransferase YrrM
MDIHELRDFTSKMQGWLSPGEGELLYKLAGKCTGDGVIVEIGSWLGKSTVWIGAASKTGQKRPVFAIDPHITTVEHKWTGVTDSFAQFEENIRNAGLEDIVKPIVKTSEEAAQSFNEPIEFLFIDGSHKYELAKLDCELWLPKVVPGGMVAMHDTTTYPGPNQAVGENVLTSNQFRAAGNRESITYADKVATNSFADRLRNRCIRWLINIKFAGRKFARRLSRPKTRN